MSLYRFAVFGIKGFSEFTRAGYESASKKFNPDDLNVDLSDQYIMITGANSVCREKLINDRIIRIFVLFIKGIGKIAALECAKRHAHVYMVCRDEKRGKEAQEEIIKESNNSNVELHLCDMSQPQDVFAFTNRFVQSKKPLNVMN
jgi:dehydrogenase/reductase SDR family protein 12